LLENDKVDYDSYEVTVACNLVKDSEGGFKFDIDLDASLGNLDEATKQSCAEGAYNFCLYFKAMKGNVDIRINQ
jgi:organic hydroperoxide reductase OsmC/OhrA